MSNEETIRMGG